MSAPTTHDPVAVNTQDGSCWTRRAVTREGRGLYALADVKGDVPELVLATLPELAEHGLASMAFALPMPSAPKSLALSEQQIEALVAAGDRVVHDAVHEDLCMCDAWPETCVSTDNYFMVAWDVSGLDTALPAVLGLWESMRGGELERLRSEVAALRDERHSTNEALDDAAKALREQRDRIAELERLIAEAPTSYVLMDRARAAASAVDGGCPRNVIDGDVGGHFFKVGAIAEGPRHCMYCGAAETGGAQ